MKMTVTLELNNATYQRAQRLAEVKKQAVADAMTDWLTTLLTADEIQLGQESADRPADDVVDREMRAYIAMHPQLKEHYFGQYVAIHGGKLVDHDDNYDEIFDRVDTAYPDEFVWLTQVDHEPLKTLVFRSPRLEPAGG